MSPMKCYDPEKAPNAREWLSVDEAGRMELIRNYHKDQEEYGESLEMHAGIHSVVENQIAMDTREVRKTLRKQDLSRHDAIHAIGSVLVEHTQTLVTFERMPEGDPNDEYYERLSQFDVSDWYGGA